MDGGGPTRLRLRAPNGTERQAEGTLVFANGGSLYVVRSPSGVPTRVGKDWFSATFRGTDLFLFLGNTVFRAPYRAAATSV